MSSFQRIPATGSADRTNFDPSTKETKAIGRSSKPLGRLSVSQNSDVAKESRTLSSTGSVPSTPHRLSLTCKLKIVSVFELS
ncbi:hypothetical protein DY000_02011415 [Brassica cretica]|uniref:Uncharacterized protein n=1 Tax=Brassica cretica TaxID=69181 RepID=A0ABQ7CRJ5_BRACR|nr:hypothetical protein DY000_02011415 [Brassica cretica]